MFALRDPFSCPNLVSRYVLRVLYLFVAFLVVCSMENECYVSICEAQNSWNFVEWEQLSIKVTRG